MNAIFCGKIEISKTKYWSPTFVFDRWYNSYEIGLREAFKKKVWNFPYFSGSGGFEKAQAINDGINQLFLERLSAVTSKILKIFLERNKEKIK